MGEYKSVRTMQDNLVRLGENPYPGRGIIIGPNSSGDSAMEVYWVMGRSEGSRARVLVNEQDSKSKDGGRVIRTEPYDLPEGTDTSLIIYNAMRRIGNTHVVSNGDQTDTIVEHLRDGKSFRDALETREYEPDAPNYTPRVSGYTTVGSVAPGLGVKYGLSTIRRGTHTGIPLRWYFEDSMREGDQGVGNCLHTYTGDGNPLPSFDGTPYSVPLGETVDEVAETYWKTLNADNRVALVVKGIRIASGEETYRIINLHGLAC